MDFNEENEKIMILQGEHDNFIMDHGDLTRKCGENRDVFNKHGETMKFYQGKPEIRHGEIEVQDGPMVSAIGCPKCPKLVLKQTPS